MIPIVIGVSASVLYLGLGFMILLRLFSAYGVQASKSTSTVGTGRIGVNTVVITIVWPIVFLFFIPDLHKSLSRKRHT